jgi:hypothetical protein
MYVIVIHYSNFVILESITNECKHCITVTIILFGLAYVVVKVSTASSPQVRVIMVDDYKYHSHHPTTIAIIQQCKTSTMPIKNDERPSISLADSIRKMSSIISKSA